jgi:hypothetical protein
LAASAAAVVLTASAGAGETRIERSQTCVCTSGQGPHAMPPMPSVPPMPPVPPIPPVPPVPPTPGASWQGGDGQNVMVFGDGGQGEQVIVIRRHDRMHDSADANKDGKVTRREFLDRAERHFKERDKNGDGRLDDSELAPMPHRIVLPPAAQQD